jgi:hypothetical protein
MMEQVEAQVVTMEDNKEQEAQQIDSSSVPANKKPETKQIVLTEDDKTLIGDQAFDRAEKVLEETFERVQKKSEFLIKL